MGEKETTLKEVGEMLAYVVEHMATKEDIADIRREMATKEELGATNKELKSFRQEFNDFRDETRQNFREIRACETSMHACTSGPVTGRHWSFDSLNGRVRCGLRPCSFQTRCTVVWPTPIG